MDIKEIVNPLESAKKNKRKRKWRIVLIIVGVLLCVRIALPYVILHYANKKLASLDGYYGHIDDIDLRLYRGAYVIKEIYINKVSPGDTSDFFSCPHIDLAVDWDAIFQKKFVGEVKFDKPILKYILGKNIGKDVKKDSTDFIQLVKDFLPMRINRFSVEDGEIHYLDLTKSTAVDLPMTHVKIQGTGLSNESDSTILLPASINLSASLYNGTVAVNTKLDPLNDIPTLDLNCVLTNTNLVNFNPFFNAYGNFDVEAGTMSLYMEIAARDNAFTGYVKPIITDIDVVHFDKEEGSPPQILWEAFLGTTLTLVTNRRTDQVATRIPLDGKFEKPNVDVLQAVLSLLSNAFIEALKPSLDNSVSIATIPHEKKKLIDRIIDRKD